MVCLQCMNSWAVLPVSPTGPLPRVGACRTAWEANWHGAAPVVLSASLPWDQGDAACAPQQSPQGPLSGR